MKTGLMISLIIILNAAIGFTADQSVSIHQGFATGQDYIAMTQSQRRAYAMGTIDGILLAPFFGAPKEKMEWIESYLENMTDKQVATILSKYLEDNPGRWHDPLHILMYSAIKEAYDKTGLTDK